MAQWKGLKLSWRSLVCIIVLCALMGLRVGHCFPIHRPVAIAAGRATSTALLDTSQGNEEAPKPRVVIEYCPGCRWMLRSAWYAQELLTTFEASIGEVALKPSRVSGTFTIRVNNDIIWDRKNPNTLGFPEVKQIKQLVRDKVDPDRDLGHSDRSSHPEKKTTQT